MICELCEEFGMRRVRRQSELSKTLQGFYELLLLELGCYGKGIANHCELSALFEAPQLPGYAQQAPVPIL